MKIIEIKDQLESVFDKKQSDILAEIIFDSSFIKTSDFNELKSIVKELAEAQKESEHRLTRVEKAIEESEHRLTRVEKAIEKSEHRLRIILSGDDYKKTHNVEPVLMVAASYISPNLMQKIVNLPQKIEIFSYEGEEEE